MVDSNSLKTCYDQATTAVAAAGPYQTPWLDDNGDGLANPADGSLAQNRYIASSFGSFRPQIKLAFVTVANGSGTLMAEVERGAEDIDLVWAAVYPPSFVAPTVTTLDLGEPVLLLEANPDQDGVYATNYPNGFTEEGPYRVVFYTQDLSGIHAQPKSVTIGGSQIYLPVVLR